MHSQTQARAVVLVVNHTKIGTNIHLKDKAVQDRLVVVQQGLANKAEMHLHTVKQIQT